MVLLKNEGGLLPLTPGAGRIAVIGPLADNRRRSARLLGVPRAGERRGNGAGRHAVLISRATRRPCMCRAARSGGEGAADIPAAVAAAEAADVVVLVLGESDGHERRGALAGASRPAGPPAGPAGRGRRDGQAAGGRADERPPAGHPAPGRAGDGAAGGLARRHPRRARRRRHPLRRGEPVGQADRKLAARRGADPASTTRTKHTGRPVGGAGTTQFEEPFKSTYLDEPNAPLFPFGFGLSYTTFDYRDLVVEQPVLGPDGTLVVTAVVRNSGDRAGTEVVQLYVRDLVGSVTRPVKELKGFQRVTLAAGRGADGALRGAGGRSRLLEPGYALHGRAGRVPGLGRPARRRGAGRRIRGTGSVMMQTELLTGAWSFPEAGSDRLAAGAGAGRSAYRFAGGGGYSRPVRRRQREARDVGGRARLGIPPHFHRAPGSCWPKRQVDLVCDGSGHPGGGLAQRRSCWATQTICSVPSAGRCASACSRARMSYASSFSAAVPYIRARQEAAPAAEHRRDAHSRRAIPAESALSFRLGLGAEADGGRHLAAGAPGRLEHGPAG